MIKGKGNKNVKQQEEGQMDVRRKEGKKEFIKGTVLQDGRGIKGLFKPNNLGGKKLFG